MGKIIEIIRELFPILQPEWIRCRSRDVPQSVLHIFNEEEEYLRRIGKKKIDVRTKGYRYIYKNGKEKFMRRRKVSLI